MNFKKIKQGLGLAGIILAGALSNPLSAQYKETDFERVYPLVNNLSQPIQIEKQKTNLLYSSTNNSFDEQLQIPVVNILYESSKSEKQKKDREYNRLEASFIGLAVADHIITLKGLEKGAIEANPLVKLVDGNPYTLAAIKTGGIGLALYLNRKIRKYDTKYAKGFLIVTNLFYGFVVSHNFKVVRKL